MLIEVVLFLLVFSLVELFNWRGSRERWWAWEHHVNMTGIQTVAIVLSGVFLLYIESFDELFIFGVLFASIYFVLRVSICKLFGRTGAQSFLPLMILIIMWVSWNASCC